MKENKIFIFPKIIFPIFLLIGLLISACDIDKNINNSPNAINQDKVKSVEGVYGLSISLQVAAADYYQRDRSRIASIWTWQVCAPPGIARAQFLEWNAYYMTSAGETEDMWALAYRGIRIANDIIEFAPEVDFKEDNTGITNVLVGMAKTYKALFLGELTAFYGSIPINIVGLEPPAFVTQAEAYAEVQKLLDEALVNFTETGAYSRDLNYGGDGAKWTAMAHSLKARYFLHVKNYTNALTEANQGITSANDNLWAIFSNNAGEYSEWGQFAIDEGDPLRCDWTYMRLLKSEPGDKRLAEYFTTPVDAAGEYYGYAVRNEAQAADEEKDIKYTASLKKYATYDAWFPLCSYEEVVLIKAECKARANDLTGAAADVNIIRTQAGLPDYTAGTQAEAIAEILKQKYMQLFLEGQCYHDMRRTGTLPDDIIPKRWLYPDAEITTNPNVPDDDDHLVYDILDDKYKQ
ncbi:MAG: RagB/SusD family nutrient uptake outer membrane protein [Bacteroidota bacterium]|nr:RagB/SusD family nutrient uptake outer membrane protein [Bacteroidota bacterium]